MQDDRLMVRMTKAEKKEIEKAAAADSRSVSQWCRLVLLKAAKDINRLPPMA